MTNKISEKILLIWSGMIGIASLVFLVICFLKSTLLDGSGILATIHRVPFFGDLFTSYYVVGCVAMVLIGLPAIAQFVLIYLGRESSFKAGVVSAILWVAVFGVLAINAANAILCIIIALLQLIPILFGHRFYQNLKKESNYVNHWSSVALEHATFHRS